MKIHFGKVKGFGARLSIFTRRAVYGRETREFRHLDVREMYGVTFGEKAFVGFMFMDQAVTERVSGAPAVESISH